MRHLLEPNMTKGSVYNITANLSFECFVAPVPNMFQGIMTLTANKHVDDACAASSLVRTAPVGIVTLRSREQM
jgi:hypothetical protein